MKIEIDFRPDDGPRQTLYADLPAKEVEKLEAAIADPDAADDVVQIPSRTKPNGPAQKWMFRVSRITIRRTR